VILSYFSLHCYLQADMDVGSTSAATASAAAACLPELDAASRAHMLAFMRCCTLLVEVLCEGAELPQAV
jgi:hypothetical protein